MGAGNTAPQKSVYGTMRLSISAICAVVLASGCGQNPLDFDRTCTVPNSSIFDGGLARDAIPALTNPEVVPAAGATFLRETDRVLGLVINEEARAYPFNVLWWHEIVNDTLGGEPVLMTYCPLTGSGIAFDPRVDGSPRNFGVSGLLFRSNLTMFDRQTETLWNQMLLSGICGLDRGATLRRLPLVETTWSFWKTLHPSTTVMTETTGFERPYGLYPYGDYDQPFNTFIDALSKEDRAKITDARPPKELGLGLAEDNSVSVYSHTVLTGMGAVVAVNVTVRGQPVLVTYVRSHNTAMAFDRRLGDRTLTLEVASEQPVRFTDAETGTVWDAAGRAVEGPLAGTQLPLRADAYAAFWFAWSIYFDALDLFLPVASVAHCHRRKTIPRCMASFGESVVGRIVLAVKIAPRRLAPVRSA